MLSFFERVKHRLLVDKIYLYLLIGVLAFIIISLIVYFLFFRKPLQPHLPSNLYRGLVAYWPMEDISRGGGALDFSRNNNFALVRGNPQVTKGKVSKALRFDGSDDFLEALYNPSFDIKSSITIEGWFKVEGPASQELIPWGLKGYKYKQLYVIDNTNSASDFENIQLKFVLDTESLISSGRLSKDCKDLRFTDSDEVTLLNFWLEKGCNTSETIIWVKIPYLPAKSKKNIYLYYGNLNEEETLSSYQKTMEVPPLVWWNSYWDTQAVLSGLEINPDFGFLTGSLLSDEGYPLVWMRIIDPQGQDITYGEYESSYPEEIKDTAKIGRNLLVGGYVEKNGQRAWMAKIVGKLFYFSWDFEKDYSSGPDEITAVGVDKERNIILAGQDSIPGNPQWRVIKVSPQGKIIWEYKINPSDGADGITDLVVDSKNFIIVSGYDKSLGNDRWRIEKLSPDGDLIYSYRLDASDFSDVPLALALDSQDNVIVAGYDYFSGNSGWRIIKIDPQGRRMWQLAYNLSQGPDEARSVVVDSRDNVIVAGVTSEGGALGWKVIKFNSQGEKVWEWGQRFQGGNSLKFAGLTPQDDIILAGDSEGEGAGVRLVKISERKSVYPEPRIVKDKLDLVKPLSENSIIEKPDSFRFAAALDKTAGFIGFNPISYNIEPNKWYHFAVTYDGTRQNLYLNGKLVNTRRVTGDIPLNRNNVYIGYNFKGIIDELKVYNRVLSPQEVSILYNWNWSRK